LLTYKSFFSNLNLKTSVSNMWLPSTSHSSRTMCLLTEL